MSETTKTLAFVAVAMVALGAGWATKPSSAVLDVKTLVGEVLAKNFNDPAEAKRLRVVKFDEDYGDAARLRSGRARWAVDDSVEERLPGRRREANGRGGDFADGPEDSGDRE